MANFIPFWNICYLQLNYSPDMSLKPSGYLIFAIYMSKNSLMNMATNHQREGSVFVTSRHGQKHCTPTWIVIEKVCGSEIRFLTIFFPKGWNSNIECLKYNSSPYFRAPKYIHPFPLQNYYIWYVYSSQIVDKFTIFLFFLCEFSCLFQKYMIHICVCAGYDSWK